jgi:hypothetical protein
MVGVGASIRRYVGWTENMWVLVAIFPNSSEDDSFDLLWLWLLEVHHRFFLRDRSWLLHGSDNSTKNEFLLVVRFWLIS